jgi:hypothetical protein
LPVTGSEVFGREEDIAFLDNAWANPQVNVVTTVAWGGVGKATLVNHWLRRTAAEHYRSAQLVFGWSFYRQGTNGLAAFNTGLCVITTRTPVVDIADHERTSTRRRELEQLSNDAGAKLLQALGVKGHEAELRKASAAGSRGFRLPLW